MIVLIILAISKKHNSFNKVFVVIGFCLYLCRRFPTVHICTGTNNNFRK